nr:leukocyte immunoglobulin-like receptor subfamily A member 5 [Equus asinus]
MDPPPELLLQLSESLLAAVGSTEDESPSTHLWADPGPVVTKWSLVTIWCQESLQADVYNLYRERVSKPFNREAPQDSSKKTSFSIESMSSHTAGLYQCAYNTSRNGWSERSDPLPLVVTGFYSKPSFSALPSPVVTTGGNVTLQCGSQLGFDRFVLTKEGEHQPSWTLDSQRPPQWAVPGHAPGGPRDPQPQVDVHMLWL